MGYFLYILLYLFINDLHDISIIPTISHICTLWLMFCFHPPCKTNFIHCSPSSHVIQFYKTVSNLLRNYQCICLLPTIYYVHYFGSNYVNINYIMCGSINTFWVPSSVFSAMTIWQRSTMLRRHFALSSNYTWGDSGSSFCHSHHAAICWKQVHQNIFVIMLPSAKNRYMWLSCMVSIEWWWHDA